VRRLVAAGHDVTVYDNLCAGHRAAVHPAAKLIVGDLADGPTLQAVLAAGRFDVVLHFAAYLDVGESVREPLRYYRNNVANTLTLLEGMKDAGIRRLVFSSSCAVYGVPEQVPITEDCPTRPISPYGATKLAMEWVLRDSIAWGLGSISLRYFNAAGAAADGSIGEAHDPEVHLIPRILRVALGLQERVQIYGDDYPTRDGTCVRDFIHVDDLANAHVGAVLAVRPGIAESYNVGTGSGFSVLEIVESARTVTGHAIPCTVSERRSGDPPVLVANATRICNLLGWKPSFRSADRIVETAWNWHKAHPGGYADR